MGGLGGGGGGGGDDSSLYDRLLMRGGARPRSKSSKGKLLSKMLPNHVELHPPNQDSHVGAGGLCGERRGWGWGGRASGRYPRRVCSAVRRGALVTTPPCRTPCLLCFVLLLLFRCC